MKRNRQMSSFKDVFCRLRQANLNPALWDLHKLRAWGVVAVSLVLCILVLRLSLGISKGVHPAAARRC